VAIIIDLDELREKSRVEVDNNHDWGYQLRLVNNDKYCGKFMVLTNVKRGSDHYHKDKQETFIVLSGQVHVEIDNDSGVGWMTLCVGDKVTIEPGEKHLMQAVEVPSIILEVSTHDDDNDTYRVQD
jgi:quercetin dioxygenase-like cupin family protein